LNVFKRMNSSLNRLGLCRPGRIEYVGFMISPERERPRGIALHAQFQSNFRDHSRLMISRQFPR
jgi:hypothetical protein